MSETRRDPTRISSISPSSTSSRSYQRPDEPDRHDSRKSIRNMENLDRTVYVGNLPTEKFTDREFIDFFKPYGSISDIRVFKDHLFVQYHRIDQATQLLHDGRKSLIFRSHQLDICPAEEYLSSKRKSSSVERSSKRSAPRSDESIDRKRFVSKHPHHSSDLLNSKLDHQRSMYSILSGSKDSKEIVDCQIFIVNMRQRNYAEEIESRLVSSGIRTSIRLLREDVKLTDAIENARTEQCLYAIIAMPMHEERRTASFHILYGQTEEHRNLTLEDGYHILVTNYLSYKERLRQLELKSSTDRKPLLSASEASYHLSASSMRTSHEPNNSLPLLTINDKFPLPMLLCLLADGRQLTLDEIDRILVYLLEKKAKMLTLPSGTLPPLPAQYATKTSTHYLNDKSSPMISNGNVHPKPELTNEKSFPTVIAEQIRQMMSNNLTPTTNGPVEMRNVTLDSIPNIVKTEQMLNTNPRESQLSTGNNGTLPSSFHPSPQSMATTVNPFLTSTFPAFNTLNPSFKPTPTSNSNPLSQASDYLYSLASSTNLYPLSINATPTDALYQTYSQLNALPLLTAATLNQQMLRPPPTSQPPQTKQET